MIRACSWSERKWPNFRNILGNRAANQRPCRCVSKGPAIAVFLLVTLCCECCVSIADRGVRWNGERRWQSSYQWWGMCSQQVPRSYVLATQDGWWRRATRSEKVGLQELRTNWTSTGISVGLEDVGIERDDLVTGPDLGTVKWGLRSWCCCRAPALLLYIALNMFSFGEEMVIVPWCAGVSLCLPLENFWRVAKKIFTETSCNKDQFNVN